MFTWKDLLHSVTSFLVTNPSVQSRYAHGKYSDELYFLLPPVETYTTTTYHTTSKESNHLYFLRIPNVTSTSSPQELLLYGRAFDGVAFLNTSISNFSSQRSIVNFLPYLYNLQLTDTTLKYRFPFGLSFKLSNVKIGQHLNG